MRHWLALGCALLATACATTSEGGEAPTPHWLAGTWLLIEPDLHFPTACASSLPIEYRRDGTYVLFDEQGRWRLDGDRLTETMTEAFEHGEADPQRIGRPYYSRVRRMGRNAFVKIFADGAPATFRRCPPAG